VTALVLIVQAADCSRWSVHWQQNFADLCCLDAWKQWDLIGCRVHFCEPDVVIAGMQSNNLDTLPDHQSRFETTLWLLGSQCRSWRIGVMRSHRHAPVTVWAAIKAVWELWKFDSHNLSSKSILVNALLSKIVESFSVLFFSSDISVERGLLHWNWSVPSLLIACSAGLPTSPISVSPCLPCEPGKIAAYKKSKERATVAGERRSLLLIE